MQTNDVTTFSVLDKTCHTYFSFLTMHIPVNPFAQFTLRVLKIHYSGPEESSTLSNYFQLNCDLPSIKTCPVFTCYMFSRDFHFYDTSEKMESSEQLHKVNKELDYIF